MTGFWLVSYVILWVVVIFGGLAVLAIAREIEQIYKKLETLQNLLQDKPAEENQTRSR